MGVPVGGVDLGQEENFPADQLVFAKDAKFVDPHD
jgi:hypothetical protein